MSLTGAKEASCLSADTCRPGFYHGLQPVLSMRLHIDKQEDTGIDSPESSPSTLHTLGAFLLQHSYWHPHLAHPCVPPAMRFAVAIVAFAAMIGAVLATPVPA
jgi:hypothetical protein